MSAKYGDIDIFGNVNLDGSIIEYYDDDAIKNALTLWLSSKKGDFLLNPAAGGVLDNSLFKNINTSSMTLLASSVKTAMTNFFSPRVKFQNIDVNPDYVNRLIEITVTYVIPSTNKVGEITIFTKDLFNVVQQQYEDIPYVEENLRMFCLIKKPDMTGKPLVYNEDNNRWEWGHYYFSNFNPQTDSFASTILAICNNS